MLAVSWEVIPGRFVLAGENCGTHGCSRCRASRISIRNMQRALTKAMLQLVGRSCSGGRQSCAAKTDSILKTRELVLAEIHLVSRITAGEAGRWEHSLSRNDR